MCEMIFFIYFNLLFLCMWLQVIDKVKVTNQGEGQINVKVKSRSAIRRGTLTCVVFILIKWVLVYVWYSCQIMYNGQSGFDYLL